MVEEEGNLEAINEDDPEADPIPLVIEDLFRYSLDLEIVAKYFQETNHLGGKSAPLDDHLYFLGFSSAEGAKAAVILGFFNNEINALRYLRGLPNLLIDSYDRYIVVCPSYTPTPTVVRELSSFHTNIVTLSKDNPWVIDLKQEIRPAVRKGRRVVLSEAEEDEIKRYSFRVRLPIHISANNDRKN